MVYSLDRRVREQVRAGVGPRLSVDGPPIEWVEVATGPIVIDKVERGRFDLLILDAEAPKHGGMGLLRQIKEEIKNPPPAIVLIARPEDRWLASWSLAEGVVEYPFDPLELHTTAKEILVGAATR